MTKRILEVTVFTVEQHLEEHVEAFDVILSGIIDYIGKYESDVTDVVSDINNILSV